LEDVALQHMLWNKQKDSGSDDISTDTSNLEELRGKADEAFCQEDFALAAVHYRDAAHILLDRRVLEVESAQDSCELLNLLSQQCECLFRLERWLEASQVAEQALSIDPDHVSSLYRHAISNWRGHVPTGKDFNHLIFWAKASQSYDRMVELDSEYMHSKDVKDDEADAQEEAENQAALFLFNDSDSENIIKALNDVKRPPLKKLIKTRALREETRQDSLRHGTRDKKNGGHRDDRQRKPLPKPQNLRYRHTRLKSTISEERTVSFTW